MRPAAIPKSPSSFAKGVCVGALLVVSFIAGSGTSRQDRAAGLVEGTGFRLVDEHGKTRGSWTVRKNEASLVMTDAKGKTRVAILVDEFPVIKLWGEQGENGLLLSQSEAKGSWVELSDQNGKGRVHLQAHKDIASESLRDADGHIRVDLVCDRAGLGHLKISDEHDKLIWTAGAGTPLEGTEKK